MSADKIFLPINNFQRPGAKSNAHVGSEFERSAQEFFATTGIYLVRNFSVEVGATAKKKKRNFDLGSVDPSMLVECKSHTWTQSQNSPSAKITTWNEAMYYFHISPKKYRKILFVLKSVKNGITLCEHYLKNYQHLVPERVELWEYDSETREAERRH